ncbi:membrane-anchored junction protein [Perognathus longimembris pacificus]|uniref:membrane-anchored junction protein n=1 Tax=Perognathus longimembris pacificus TaxID=214514 RepID=UPI0020185425|nr:membrane-anchored junction protein [Perognathus longimembris pacificus]
MTLKPFTYPFPETRFFHAGSNVYKFKIRYGNSIRGEEIENKEVIIQELEDSIRAVLGNVDDLQPFVTEHFVVFPYKSKWERVSYLKFKHEEAVLVPYPFVFTLYVEMKWLHENLTPGKSINNSPLGLDLAEKKAAEATMRKRKLLEEPGSPSRAKMGTSSQGLSKKKPPVETRRSRERETQQEWQETPAFDTMDIQEQDSKWGYGFPEPSVPPAQQNDLPPPKKQGASGFFRFLSTLFPFRYFFKKSNQ